MSTFWMLGRGRWLGRLNFLVLQWFFVRLAREVNQDGSHIRWVWGKGVVPLTGWWSDFIYLWGKGEWT